MDKKLFGAFAGVTLGGLLYTVCKQRSLEKTFIGLCEAVMEQQALQLQIVTDMQFENIVEHFDE